MADALLEHPRALVEKVADALGGDRVARPGLAGGASSRFDAFLNQLFASGQPPAAAAGALAGRPGFVWLDRAALPRELAGVAGVRPLVMQGMAADLAPGGPSAADHDVEEVESAAVLADWHGVYSDVLASAPDGLADWRGTHVALGPAGDGSLHLLLARLDGVPAATGAVFFHGGIAGLYCFATRPGAQRRGLASALIAAAHAAARGRGVRRAVLQATPAGRPVYARAGYVDVRPLPVLRVSGRPAAGCPAAGSPARPSAPAVRPGAGRRPAGPRRRPPALHHGRYSWWIRCVTFT